MRSLLLLLALPTVVFATEPRWLPDAKMTPGVTNSAITQENISQNICSTHWSTKSIRPPENYTGPLKRRQIRQYGYTDRNMRHYEEDHLIPLEVGGNPRSPHNLWPEQLNGQWGAHVKDRLENKLHKLVCNHKLTLAEAQHDIATDWIAAYKKYVGVTPRAVLHALSRRHHHKR